MFATFCGICKHKLHWPPEPNIQKVHPPGGSHRSPGAREVHKLLPGRHRWPGASQRENAQSAPAGLPCLCERWPSALRWSYSRTLTVRQHLRKYTDKALQGNSGKRAFLPANLCPEPRGMTIWVPVSPLRAVLCVCDHVDLTGASAMSIQRQVSGGPSSGSLKSWDFWCVSKPCSLQGEAGSAEFPPDCMTLWSGGGYSENMSQPSLPILQWVFPLSLDV